LDWPTLGSPSWCYNDLGISFKHLVLAAANLGLGTCWMGQTRRDTEIRKLLKISENLKIIAFTSLGVPDETLGPMEGKSLGEIVSWERYSEK
jgi:nitroreductase